MTPEAFRKIALSLPGVCELPHFDRASFRVGKRIFATLSEKENRAMLKLSLVSQSVYCSYDPGIFFPVPGGWGKKGATYVDLASLKAGIGKEAIKTAYNELTQPQQK